jgi:transposase
MTLTTVGIDLAKNVFQVHGIDEHGRVLVKKQLRRDQVATFFVNLPPFLIGMEACGSAHHWARKLQAMGRTSDAISVASILYVGYRTYGSQSTTYYVRYRTHGGDAPLVR